MSSNCGTRSARACCPCTCLLTTATATPSPDCTGCSAEVADYATGTRTKRPGTEAELAALQEPRGTLIEAIVTESEDEALLEAWVGGENIGIDTVIDDME